jgi:transcriptional regulator with XRE-family HTH domain
VTKESEIREFLTSRRARLTPEAAGLPIYGRRRRVTGLRREEVALLAGISVEYYARLERGNARGLSEDALSALATALQLTDDERSHLSNLVRLANAEGPVTPHEMGDHVRPAVRRIVDSFGGPALLRNRRLDILYANRLGAALYVEAFEGRKRLANTARYAFLDPRSRMFFKDWTRAADDMAGLLRAEAGRNPADRDLSALVDALVRESDDFRWRWDSHNVLFHREGTAEFRHPVVGPLALAYQDLDLPTDPNQTVLVFTAEPGSSSQEALSRLAVRPAKESASSASIPR